MTLAQFFYGFIGFVNFVLVPFIFALAFLMFLWGVYRLFFKPEATKDDKAKAKSFLVYSLIGFFLMISFWGIVNIFIDSVGLGGGRTPPIPGFGTDK